MRHWTVWFNPFPRSAVIRTPFSLSKRVRFPQVNEGEHEQRWKPWATPAPVSFHSFPCFQSRKDVCINSEFLINSYILKMHDKTKYFTSSQMEKISGLASIWFHWLIVLFYLHHFPCTLGKLCWLWKVQTSSAVPTLVLEVRVEDRLLIGKPSLYQAYLLFQRVHSSKAWDIYRKQEPDYIFYPNTQKFAGFFLH